ncbi:zinc finger protein 160-like [Sabethes cyaneus]|uniref:zinc finger protein 160-like n=1 Tax=Sabethes cyaneus TaxID=53552 RepID=UPI00237E6BCF|nr:zinc finger protein 160-like [Sabethes cyaneus]
MNFSIICRMCSEQNIKLKSIFSSDYVEQNLLNIITDILQLSVSANDELPSGICAQCASQLFDLQKTIQKFRRNEQILRDRILDHTIRNSEEVERNQELVLLKQEPYDIENSLEIETNPVEDLPANKEIKDQENTDTRKERKKQNENQSHLAKPRTTSITSRPKQNDNKCYICKSESMVSGKALLDHLATHTDLIPYTCSECEMEKIILMTVRSLNLHKKMHAQPVKCKYCDRRYSDERAREGHVKTFHLGEGAPCPSACEQCGIVCSSAAALKRHLRDHKNNLKCDQCDEIFHRRYKLKEHVARVHENQPTDIFECNVCHRVVHSLGSYNAHLKMHISGKTYQCELCPMKFHTAGNMRLHKKIHIDNPNYKPHRDWSGHYTVHHEPGQDKIFSCKLCGKTFTKSIIRISNHLKLHFKEIECDQCQRKFVNESQLKAHYAVHTGIRQHKCGYCAKDFMHKSNLRQHLKLHRNEQNYACEFCGKLFTYRENMKTHIRIHHLQESPYACDPCSMKFVDDASLSRHMTACHAEPYQPADLGPPPIMGVIESTNHAAKNES